MGLQKSKVYKTVKSILLTIKTISIKPDPLHLLHPLQILNEEPDVNGTGLLLQKGEKRYIRNSVIVIMAIKNVKTQSGNPIAVFIAVFIIDGIIPSLLKNVLTSKFNTKLKTLC